MEQPAARQWQSFVLGASTAALVAALLWALESTRRGARGDKATVGAAAVAAAAEAPVKAEPAAAAAAAAGGVLAIDDENDTDEVPEDVDLKMVFCVRGDLKMSPGKVAAQVGHATLGCWQAAGRDARWRAWAQAWNYRAAAKITLVVDSEAQLDAIAAAATAADLPHVVIEDAGRTEIPAGSRTVLGLGPAPIPLIDAITGRGGAIPLKLLR